MLGGPEDLLTLEEAIYFNTFGSAYQLKLESELGSLEVGKKADLIVLENNLFDLSTRDIHKTRILLTMMNGNVVYSSVEELKD